MTEEKTILEITSDPTTARSIIQQLVREFTSTLSGRPASRAIALAVTKLQEANFWLGEEMYGAENNKEG